MVNHGPFRVKDLPFEVTTGMTVMNYLHMCWILSIDSSEIVRKSIHGSFLLRCPDVGYL